MLYKEFLPSSPLHDFILLYGVLEDPVITIKQKVEKTPPIINKGLMFHYRRKSSLVIENGCAIGEPPRGFILTQGSTPNVWKHYGGFGIFAITFQPGKFRYFYPDSMLEFLNYPLTFEDFNDKGLLQLNEQIMTARNHAERIQFANAFFLKKLRSIETKNDSLQYSLQLMQQNPHLNMKQIAKIACIGDRHFRRTFSRTFGISPKKLQQLIRLTKVINLLNAGNVHRLTDIAYQCGFSDQAHFINCFKNFTGMTPMAFMREEMLITKVINYHEVVRDARGFA